MKGSPIFSRSNQDFYIIWIVLRRINDTQMAERREEIIADLKELLSLLKNVGDATLDDKYSEEYVNKLNEVAEKYA